MLAIECARLLGYRDSYMLFNKNRSLHKINATQAEKDVLIYQAILPSSVRSRPITIVTAKSMFRQFGARVIRDGKRVQDDYWEARARKQGFTERDGADDKRPGATKAKEITADLDASNDPIIHLGSDEEEQAEIYQPGLAKAGDARQQSYEKIPILEQKITATPHVDYAQPASAAEFMHHIQYATYLNNENARKAEALAKSIGLTWDTVLKKAVPWPQQMAEQNRSVAQTPLLASSTAMKEYQHFMSRTQMMYPEATFLPQPRNHQQNPPTQSLSRSTRPDLRRREPASIPYPLSQHEPFCHTQTSQIPGHPPPEPWQSLSSIPGHQHSPFLPSCFQHTSQPRSRLEQ